MMTAQPNRYSTLIWRKSSTSADAGNCVEVAKSAFYVLVRDSGDPAGAILEFSQAQWRAFVSHVKHGMSAS